MIRRRLLGFLFEMLYGPFAWWYDAVSWAVSCGRWRTWQGVALPHLVRGRVLEVGCGPGHLARSLAAQGDRVVGVDRSAPMCRLARRRLRRLPQATVVQGDGRALPFRAATFDAVVLTFPAGYVLEPATAEELARVIRPGGQLVVVFGVMGRGIVWQILSRLADGSAGEQTLVDHLTSAGFRVRPMETEVAGDRIAVVVGQRTIQAEGRPARWHGSC